MSELHEHNKVYPWSQFDAIEGFFDFLRSRGLTELTHEELRELILEWKGVNLAAYEAEGAWLAREYAWLWEKFGLTRAKTARPRIVVARPTRAAQGDAESRPQMVTGLELLLSKIRGPDV